MPTEPLVLGQVSGLYGVHGWVKIHSYTQPREGITQYDSWLLRENDGWRRYRVLSGRPQGRTVVARLDGIDDRDQAAGVVGLRIAIERDQLSPLEDGEYYWDQLIGLHVVNLRGESLGEVRHMMQTGANDVMVVQGERERLIPWVRGSVVKSVDVGLGTIHVDWGADY
ncbi:MAG: ribosome maturation factor RimM [Pseudomonadota bacterium]|nr:ribosome maturation factor RimM [Pseudomonadota bacterium]